MTPKTIALLTLLITQAPAASTQEQPATGSIEGIVLRSGPEDPLARAQVVLTRIPTPPEPGQPIAPPLLSAMIPPVVTAADGKFKFENLAAGQYRIRVVRNGFAPQEYGQRAANLPGLPLGLALGQQVKDIVFHLIEAGVVTGRVRDTNGEPVARAQIQLLRSLYSFTGERSLQGVGVATTDDRGEYRLYWVPSGRYFLVVSPQSSNVPLELLLLSSNTASFFDRTFPPTYYPGTLEVSRAVALEVRAGTELSAIDVIVPQPVTYSIRGRVVDAATGAPPPSASVSIAPRQSADAPAIPTTISGPSTGSNYNRTDGTFELRNVIPGAYWLRGNSGSDLSQPINPAALTNVRTANDLLTSVLLTRNTAQIPIDIVGADLNDVPLVLSRGITVPVRVSIEGQEIASLNRYDQIRVTLQSTVPGSSTAFQRTPLSADGTGVVEGISQGEYRVRVSLPQPELYAKEILFDRTDVSTELWQVTSETNGTLSILLSNKAAELEGDLVDGQSRPSPGTAVVLIPDQNRSRVELFKIASTDSSGHFVIRGIAPGGYKLFAWETLEPNSYFDPNVLSQYESQGRPIRLQESSKEKVELKTIATRN